MKETDKRLIEAVLRKAKALCPGALELLGVYGSAATGDSWEKSDLDLLIVADGPGGRLLRDRFILDDTGIGYDLYLTSWASLEEEADCPHAHLSKLMDADILFCRDEQTAARLAGLRKRAADILASDARFSRAEDLLRQARQEYAGVWLTEELSQVRYRAGEAVYWLLDALMLYHGRYFRLGTKRTFRELAELGLPFDPEGPVLEVLRSDTAEGIRSALTALFITLQAHMSFPKHRAPLTREALDGTYEEMVSNWRNKMYEAAERGDLFSSFMDLAALQAMSRDIADGAETEALEVLGRFDPGDLAGNARVFDAALSEHAAAYRRLGMPIRRFPDLDGFLKAYL